jgi:hypothetical protein
MGWQFFFKIGACNTRARMKKIGPSDALHPTAMDMKDETKLVMFRNAILSLPHKPNFSPPL